MRIERNSYPVYSYQIIFASLITSPYPRAAGKAFGDTRLLKKGGEYP